MQSQARGSSGTYNKSYKAFIIGITIDKRDFVAYGLRSNLSPFLYLKYFQTWIADWLMANNPNKPQVQEPVA